MVVALTDDDNGDDDQSNIIGKWKFDTCSQASPSPFASPEDDERLMMNEMRPNVISPDHIQNKKKNYKSSGAYFSENVLYIPYVCNFYYFLT